MTAEVAALDAFAARLRPHYSRFLDLLGEDILMTAHSHQAWPDVSREGHMAAWDDAADLVDAKWSKVFRNILPEFQRRIANRLGFSRPLDIAVAPNTHELVYRLGSCFPYESRVVTTDAEFHSLRRQLTRLTEDGLELTTVAVRDGQNYAERFLEAVDRVQPHWVALSQVLYTTSRVLVDLPAVLTGLADRGVPALVDTYHSFNALPLDVDRWPGTVFVTGGGYKYVQAGEGACWMVLPADAERFRPRHTGWFANFGGLNEDAPKIEYGPQGQRFLGATFDPTALYRAVWTLRWMDEEGLTPDALREQSQRATALMIAMYDRFDLEKKGLKLLTPREPSLRGAFVTFETPEAGRLYEALSLRGVRTDRRGSMLRFGPAPYTTSVEIRRSVGVLHDLVAS
ncbi:MAG: hypothetical protein AAF449_10895 [Myxococcota bacterium]